MHPLGFVGTGFHARSNLLPAASIAEVEILGLASRDVGRSTEALARAGLVGGRPFGSIRDLIDGLPQLDRVIVCAQPSDQPAIVREMLEAGLHVLAEKPLGRDAAEAQSLADLAESRVVVLRAAFMKRYAPAVLALRNMLNEGELGRVLSFDVRFGADAAAFAPTAADFVKLAAIHNVDLVRFLFGEVEHVDTVFSGSAAAYTVLVTVHMRSGAVGTLHLTCGPGHTSLLDVTTVTGERGTVTMTDTRDLAVHRGALGGSDWGALQEQRRYIEPAVSTMSGGAQDLVLRGFVDEIRSFATDDLDGNDRSAEANVRTMRFVDAIIRQLPVTREDGLLPITFGAPGAIRDSLNDAIMSGAKTSSSNLLVAYEAVSEPIPVPGEARVLLDSNDEPFAVLRFDRVSQRQLGDVDADLASLEGMGVEEWHHAHRGFWATLSPQIRAHRDGDWQLTERDVVVTTVFRVEGKPA